MTKITAYVIYIHKVILTIFSLDKFILILTAATKNTLLFICFISIYRILLSKLLPFLNFYTNFLKKKWNTPIYSIISENKLNI